VADHSHAIAGASLLIEPHGDSGDQGLGVDPATAAVLRLTQNRNIFTTFLAGSMALHLCILAAIIWLEHAPPLKPDLTREIPVELVAAPPPGPASASPGHTDGKPKADVGADKSAAPKPAAMKAAKPTVAEKTQIQPPKPAAPTPAPAKPSPPPAQTQAQKPPQPPPAPAVQKPPPSQPPAPRPAQAPPQPVQPPPQPAQPVTPPVAPAGTPEGNPKGLMQDNSPAVAVPRPTDDGDDVVSYQTLVFGMLELKKEFPDDARRRGAYGTALIYFELNDDGSVKNEKLLRSSGDAALDVESLALVQRAAPFPKPPSGAQKVFAADITFPKPD
jgi:periplasmic protein TonB